MKSKKIRLLAVCFGLIAINPSLWAICDACYTAGAAAIEDCDSFPDTPEGNIEFEQCVNENLAQYNACTHSS